MGFGDLKFGYSDAYTEAQRDPDLLRHGYYDPMGLEDEVLHQHGFLVLGQKGSGKSAFAVRLQLQQTAELLVSSMMLGDFPFADFSSLQAGGAAKEARYPTAWRWLMCLSLLESFARDESMKLDDADRFRSSIAVLKSAGWISADSLRALIVQNTRRSQVGFTLPVVGASTGKDSVTGQGLPFPAAIDTVATLVSKFKSDATHILIIDGLDDLLIEQNMQWDILSALITAANRLNEDLFSWEVEAKVVVLCRSDLFDRLPGANTNKVRQDSSKTLNWYQDIKNPKLSHLVSLANLKASVRTPDRPDPLGDYLPGSFRLESGGEFETIEYLLEYTRHTPRDFLQLLDYIAAACRSSDVIGKVPGDVIEAGVHNYCQEYFVGEVRNELFGLLSEEEIDLTKRLLRGLRRNRFFLHELETKVRNSSQYKDLPVERIIDQLFNAGLIGNLIKGGDRAQPYTRFKYRNPFQELDRDMNLVLHNAVINAFNIRRSSGGGL